MYTINHIEFEKIHNGLGDLRRSIYDLEQTLHPELLAKLTKSLELVSTGFAGVRAQESEASMNRHDHYEDVRISQGFRSVWSEYSVNNLNDQHTLGKNAKIHYRDHWGDRDFTLPVEGDTWLAVYLVAEKLINDSGDDHHIFIEDFLQSKDDPELYFLRTGS